MGSFNLLQHVCKNQGSLTIAFSEDSNKTQASKKQQILLTNGLPQHLASLTLGTHSLSENNPVRINCDDGLTLVPLKEKKLFPSTKNESRIELFGTLKTPAKLIDREADLVAVMRSIIVLVMSVFLVGCENDNMFGIMQPQTERYYQL